MTDGWNLQTNIKNKPGAQGTLFSGGKSQMSDKARYKKGYNPQRQREVQGSGLQVEDWVSPVAADKNHQPIPTGLETHIREEIKKSSVPVSHLNGLKIHVVDPNARDKSLAEEYQWQHGPHGITEDRVDGVYNAKRSRVAVRVSGALGGTLFHEIGHHASKVEGTSHSSYDSPHRRGQEEGFADAYADKHAPAGTRALAGKGAYTPFYDQHGGREDHFRDGYDQKRPYQQRRPDADDLRGMRAAEEWKKTRTFEQNNTRLPGL